MSNAERNMMVQQQHLFHPSYHQQYGLPAAPRYHNHPMLNSTDHFRAQVSIQSTAALYQNSAVQNSCAQCTGTMNYNHQVQMNCSAQCTGTINQNPQVQMNSCVQCTRTMHQNHQVQMNYSAPRTMHQNHQVQMNSSERCTRTRHQVQMNSSQTRQLCETPRPPYMSSFYHPGSSHGAPAPSQNPHARGAPRPLFISNHGTHPSSQTPQPVPSLTSDHHRGMSPWMKQNQLCPAPSHLEHLPQPRSTPRSAESSTSSHHQGLSQALSQNQLCPALSQLTPIPQHRSTPRPAVTHTSKQQDRGLPPTRNQSSASLAPSQLAPMPQPRAAPRPPVSAMYSQHLGLPQTSQIHPFSAPFYSGTPQSCATPRPPVTPISNQQHQGLPQTMNQNHPFSGSTYASMPRTCATQRPAVTPMSTICQSMPQVCTTSRYPFAPILYDHYQRVPEMRNSARPETTLPKTHYYQMGKPSRPETTPAARKMGTLLPQQTHPLAAREPWFPYSANTNVPQSRTGPGSEIRIAREASTLLSEQRHHFPAMQARFPHLANTSTDVSMTRPVSSSIGSELGIARDTSTLLHERSYPLTATQPRFPHPANTIANLPQSGPYPSQMGSVFHIAQDASTPLLQPTHPFSAAQPRFPHPANSNSNLSKIGQAPDPMASRFPDPRVISTQLTRHQSYAHPGLTAQIPSTAAEMAHISSTSAQMAQMPSTAAEMAQMSSTAAEMARIPSIAAEMAQLPSIAAEMARIPSTTTEMAQVSSTAAEMAQMPSIAAEMAQLSSTAAEMAQIPSIAAEMARIPSTTTEMAQVSSTAAEMAQMPSIAAEMAQLSSTAAEMAQIPSTTTEMAQLPSTTTEMAQVSSTPAVLNVGGNTGNTSHLISSNSSHSGSQTSSPLVNSRVLQPHNFSRDNVHQSPMSVQNSMRSNQQVARTGTVQQMARPVMSLASFCGQQRHNELASQQINVSTVGQNTEHQIHAGDQITSTVRLPSESPTSTQYVTMQNITQCATDTSQPSSRFVRIEPTSKHSAIEENTTQCSGNSETSQPSVQTSLSGEDCAAHVVQTKAPVNENTAHTSECPQISCTGRSVSSEVVECYQEAVSPSSELRSGDGSVSNGFQTNQVNAKSRCSSVHPQAGCTESDVETNNQTIPENSRCSSPGLQAQLAESNDEPYNQTSEANSRLVFDKKNVEKLQQAMWQKLTCYKVGLLSDSTASCVENAESEEPSSSETPQLVYQSMRNPIACDLHGPLQSPGSRKDTDNILLHQNTEKNPSVLKTYQTSVSETSSEEDVHHMSWDVMEKDVDVMKQFYANCGQHDKDDSSIDNVEQCNPISGSCSQNVYVGSVGKKSVSRHKESLSCVSPQTPVSEKESCYQEPVSPSPELRSGSDSTDSENVTDLYDLTCMVCLKTFSSRDEVNSHLSEHLQEQDDQRLQSQDDQRLAKERDVSMQNTTEKLEPKIIAIVEPLRILIRGDCIADFFKAMNGSSDKDAVNSIKQDLKAPTKDKNGSDLSSLVVHSKESCGILKTVHPTQHQTPRCRLEKDRTHKEQSGSNKTNAAFKPTAEDSNCSDTDTISCSANSKSYHAKQKCCVQEGVNVTSKTQVDDSACTRDDEPLQPDVENNNQEKVDSSSRPKYTTLVSGVKNRHKRKDSSVCSKDVPLHSGVARNQRKSVDRSSWSNYVNLKLGNRKNVSTISTIPRTFDPKEEAMPVTKVNNVVSNLKNRFKHNTQASRQIVNSLKTNSRCSSTMQTLDDNPDFCSKKDGGQGKKEAPKRTVLLNLVSDKMEDEKQDEEAPNMTKTASQSLASDRAEQEKLDKDASNKTKTASPGLVSVALEQERRNKEVSDMTKTTSNILDRSKQHKQVDLANATKPYADGKKNEPATKTMTPKPNISTENVGMVFCPKCNTVFTRRIYYEEHSCYRREKHNCVQDRQKGEDSQTVEERKRVDRQTEKKRQSAVGETKGSEPCVGRHQAEKRKKREDRQTEEGRKHVDGQTARRRNRGTAENGKSIDRQTEAEKQKCVDNQKARKHKRNEDQEKTAKRRRTDRHLVEKPNRVEDGQKDGDENIAVKRCRGENRARKRSLPVRDTEQLRKRQRSDETTYSDIANEVHPTTKRHTCIEKRDAHTSKSEHTAKHVGNCLVRINRLHITKP